MAGRYSTHLMGGNRTTLLHFGANLSIPVHKMSFSRCNAMRFSMENNALQ